MTWDDGFSSAKDYEAENISMQSWKYINTTYIIQGKIKQIIKVNYKTHIR